MNGGGQRVPEGHALLDLAINQSPKSPFLRVVFLLLNGLVSLFFLSNFFFVAFFFVILVRMVLFFCFCFLRKEMGGVRMLFCGSVMR